MKTQVPTYDSHPIKIDGSGKLAPAIRLADGRFLRIDHLDERSIVLWENRGAQVLPGDGSTIEHHLSTGYLTC